MPLLDWFVALALLLAAVVVVAHGLPCSIRRLSTPGSVVSDVDWLIQMRDRHLAIEQVAGWWDWLSLSCSHLNWAFELAPPETVCKFGFKR